MKQSFARLFLLTFFTSIFGTIPADTIYHAHLPSAWYPHDNGPWKKLAGQMVAKAKAYYKATVTPDSIRMVMVPHASFFYSGSVATAVYSLLSNASSVQRLIILAPDHSGVLQGVALPSATAYQLPMGTLPIDTAVVTQLKNAPHFNYNDAVFATEHSLEVQLPLIIKFFPQITIVPLLVGDLSCKQATTVAATLKKYIDPTTVVIISTDFIHYGKRFNFTPFNDHVQLRVRDLNSSLIQSIENGSCHDFDALVKKTKATVCGFNPLKVALSLLENNSFGVVEPRLVAYDTSSTSDEEDFVSYVGMVFTTERLAQLPFAEQLTQQEKVGLLQEAVDVLHYLFDKDFQESLYYPIRSRGVMQANGLFVTLRTKKDKQLRGCIGKITTSLPLYKTVAAVTKDSSLHDPRFSPLTSSEIDGVTVELSVLSPLTSIDNYKKITIGRDGMVLHYNGKSALFLPSVATEFHWNLEQTLTQLARKAGLDDTSWREKGATFDIFTTVDIGD